MVIHDREKHNQRQMKSLPCIVYAVCTTSLSWKSFCYCIETIYPYHDKCTQKKEHVVPPLKHQASALIHFMQFKFLKVAQWDHYSEVLFCLTVRSQPAYHFELRMFVAIGHNSVQREIRAFTFCIISKWFTDLQCQGIRLLLCFDCYFSIIIWCW